MRNSASMPAHTHTHPNLQGCTQQECVAYDATQQRDPEQIRRSQGATGASPRVGSVSAACASSFAPASLFLSSPPSPSLLWGLRLSHRLLLVPPEPVEGPIVAKGKKNKTSCSVRVSSHLRVSLETADKMCVHSGPLAAVPIQLSDRLFQVGLSLRLAHTHTHTPTPSVSLSISLLRSLLPPSVPPSLPPSLLPPSLSPSLPH